MNISFGKKLPITTCQIYDNKHQKSIPVTCYKFDCNDKSDFQEIEKLNDDDWQYTCETVSNMKNKFRKTQRGQHSDVVVFTLEKQNGEKIGLCCAEDTEHSIDVNYFETRQNGEHKYAGQALLASIGTEVLNNNQGELKIHNAISSAYDFYEKICGFTENIQDYCLSMNRLGIRRFIRQTEQRTKGQIIEVEA